MKKKSLLLIAVATLGLTVATMAQSVPSYVPTNGLVGWWPFNGNANDESGNGNNGTVNGATLTTDRIGNLNNAYSFDGINDDIYLSNQTSLGSQNIFSISMWININSYGSAQQSLDYSTIYMKNNPWYSTAGWSLLLNRDINNINSRGINLYIAGSSPYIFPFNFQINTWYHVVLTINNNTAKLYINNTLINSISGIQNLPINTTGSYIGNGNTQVSASYLFLGKFDDIGLWNSALTQQEITNLYNANIVGINETSRDNVFSVFPNPAQSLINIKADSKLIGEIYTIYDNTGRAVLTGKLHSQNTTIELGNLSGGIYMFSVGENMKQTFKVIKE